MLDIGPPPKYRTRSPAASRRTRAAPTPGKTSAICTAPRASVTGVSLCPRPRKRKLVQIEQTSGWLTLRFVQNELTSGWQTLRFVQIEQTSGWQTLRFVQIEQTSGWLTLRFVQNEPTSGWQNLKFVQTEQTSGGRPTRLGVHCCSPRRGDEQLLVHCIRVRLYWRVLVAPYDRTSRDETDELPSPRLEPTSCRRRALRGRRGPRRGHALAAVPRVGSAGSALRGHNDGWVRAQRNLLPCR